MGWADEPTLESLKADYEQSMKDLSQKYRQAKTDEERKAVLADRPDQEETATAMMELIEKNAEDPKVLDSLAWMFMALRQAPSDEVQALIENHKGSKELSGILMAARYDRSGKLNDLVKWAREGSPHKEVQAVAAYLASQDRGISDEEKLKELKFAAANAGDAESRGTKIADQAKGALFELEHLQIGQVAGEIEGEDQEGVSFKLSDYRGKVVVLDFWGDW